MIFLVTLKGDYGKCVHAQQGLNIINIICKSQVIFCLIQHKSPKETSRLQGEEEILLYIDCEYPKGISFFSYSYHQQRKSPTQKATIELYCKLATVYTFNVASAMF